MVEFVYYHNVEVVGGQIANSPVALKKLCIEANTCWKSVGRWAPDQSSPKGRVL